jgi:hypothetical protein
MLVVTLAFMQKSQEMARRAKCSRHNLKQFSIVGNGSRPYAMRPSPNRELATEAIDLEPESSAGR